MLCNGVQCLEKGVVRLMPKSSSDIKLPQRKPPDYSLLSQEQFNVEIEKGIADFNTGRIMSSKQVRETMKRKHRT